MTPYLLFKQISLIACTVADDMSNHTVKGTWSRKVFAVRAMDAPKYETIKPTSPEPHHVSPNNVGKAQNPTQQSKR